MDTKSNLLKLLLVACLLINCQALFENSLSIQKLEKTEELANTYLGADFLTAVLFYCDNPLSIAFEPVFIEFAELKKNLYRFVAVDCELFQNHTRSIELAPACNPQYRDYLPQIIFIEPAEQRIDPTTNKIAQPKQHRYTGEATFEDLSEFAKDIMPSFHKTLISKRDLEKFLAYQPNLNKVLMFLNKRSLPGYLKALTSSFKGRLLFGEVLPRGTSLHKKYDVRGFPTFIVLVKKEGGFEEIVYKGDASYKDLEKFLEKYAPEKSSEPVTRLHPEDEAIPPEEVKTLLLDKFEETVYGNEGLVLLHLFRENTFHKTFNQTLSKFGNVLEMHHLNCTADNVLTFCQDTLKIKKFPAYRLYPIGTRRRKLNSKIIFSESIEFSEIAKEISDVVDDPSRSLSVSNINKFMREIVETKLPGVILFHNQDEINLSFRVFAGLKRYNDHIIFGNFKNPPEDLKKEYSIEKIPTLASVFFKDPDNSELTLEENLEIGIHTGTLASNEIRHFLQTFLPAEAKREALSQTVTLVDNANEFERVCKQEDKICVVGLIDGYTGNDYAELRVKSELVVLEAVQAEKALLNLTFIWIDAECHFELLDGFGQLSELPTLIYYDHSAGYKRLGKPYSRDNITDFLLSAIKTRGSDTGSLIEGDIKLENKNCAIYHNQRSIDSLTKASPPPTKDSPSITPSQIAAGSKTQKSESKTKSKIGSDREEL